jgi:hypothetical protein
MPTRLYIRCPKSCAKRKITSQDLGAESPLGIRLFSERLTLDPDADWSKMSRKTQGRRRRQFHSAFTVTSQGMIIFSHSLSIVTISRNVSVNSTDPKP